MRLKSDKLHYLNSCLQKGAEQSSNYPPSARAASLIRENAGFPVPSPEGTGAYRGFGGDVGVRDLASIDKAGPGGMGMEMAVAAGTLGLTVFPPAGGG